MLLASIVFVTSSAYIKAEEVVSHYGLGTENEVVPFVETACPYGANHYMVSKGWGTAYYGEAYDTSRTLVANGASFQCKNCLMVFISEGDPLSGYESIGTYATVGSSIPITVYSTIWTKTYGYTSNTTLSGYRFYVQ